MTKQDKVTVDDIIGIVKTEEQTNSVEEVRKLRGRGNETAKRFTHKINQLGMQFICYDDKAELLGTFADADGVTHIVKLLNELHEENEQLKQSNKDAWNLIRFIYNEIKEDGYMDWGRIQDLVEF